VDALDASAQEPILQRRLGAETTAVVRESAQEPQGGEEDLSEGIDPEYMAALPPELQAEVLEQHMRERRLRQLAAMRERERSEAAAAGPSNPNAGQSAEDADLASILATFPEGLREEVLLE